MEPTDYMDKVLDMALAKALAMVKESPETNHSVTALVDSIKTTAFDIIGCTAVVEIVWRMIPNESPTKAFDLPTTLRFDVDTDVYGASARVVDMRVVSRSGCDIEIAGVGTIVEGEDYTDSESAGGSINLPNYVNHQLDIADNLWASARFMAGV